MKKVICILFSILSICIISKINAYTEYKVGDEVTYNNVDYYVIKDSSSNETSVTMLKKEPLTVEEVNLYGGVGTANNHVNMYVATSSAYYQMARNENGYGGMAYYSSASCINYGDTSGCRSDYASSEVKYVVDAWAQVQVPSGLQLSRLITIEDLEGDLGYEQNPTVVTQKLPNPTNTPNWVYNSNYSYWTGSQYMDSVFNAWKVLKFGNLGINNVNNSGSGVVRPVIVLSKSVLEADEDESVIEEKDEIYDTDNKIDKENDKNDNTSKEVKEEKSDNKVSSKVKVANTYMSKSLTIIVVGFIVSVLSILIFYKYVNKKV